MNIKEAAKIAMNEGKCIFMRDVPGVKIRPEKTDMCTLMLRDGSHPKTGWQQLVISLYQKIGTLRNKFCNKIN